MSSRTGASRIPASTGCGGVLDPAWLTAGNPFHETVLTIQTAVYNFAIHDTHLVTAGYGRNTGTTNDYVSLRFGLASGQRDLTWGGAPNGAVVFDPSGRMLGSNCRNAIALPHGKTLMTGSTGPSNMPSQDAVFAVLDASGALDTRYGDGVGYQGGLATQTDLVNDDAYGVVFEIQ